VGLSGGVAGDVEVMRPEPLDGVTSCALASEVKGMHTASIARVRIWFAVDMLFLLFKILVGAV
jgi:hypothetical protein